MLSILLFINKVPSFNLGRKTLMNAIHQTRKLNLSLCSKAKLDSCKIH